MHDTGAGGTAKKHAMYDAHATSVHSLAPRLASLPRSLFGEPRVGLQIPEESHGDSQKEITF